MRDGMKQHERANRELWNQQADWYQESHGVPISAKPDAWGSWRIPEAELHLLPSVHGLDVLELDCGGGQWTAWLAEQGARVTGIDISERQLEHARALLDSKGLQARLVPGSAEDLPFEAAGFDLIISDHGAMSWADPARTVPEAARVLRPGGQLIFCATSVLMILVAWNEETGATDRLERDYFGLAAIEENEGCATTFSRPHGEWIRLFREKPARRRGAGRAATAVGSGEHVLPGTDRRLGATVAGRDDLGREAREVSQDLELRQLRRMFAYNDWATLRLIEFCQTLDSASLNLTAAGTLGPIERTLTHLVSSEQFYLRDLTGEDPPTWIESKIVSLEVLAARSAENAARWLAYLDTRPNPDEKLENSWRGRPAHVLRWGSLTQALVHGVEHRTHVCTILGANGIEPPDISVGAFADKTSEFENKERS